jgi:hypothetical protein
MIVQRLSVSNAVLLDRLCARHVVIQPVTRYITTNSILLLFST